MPSTCCVENCNNRHNSSLQISYHSFPQINLKRRKHWIDNINRKTANGKQWTPSPCSRVCSDHFLECDYYPAGQKKTHILKPHAVPSVFNTHGRTRSKSRNFKEMKAQVKLDSKLRMIAGLEDGTGKNKRLVLRLRRIDEIDKVKVKKEEEEFPPDEIPELQAPTPRADVDTSEPYFYINLDHSYKSNTLPGSVEPNNELSCFLSLEGCRICEKGQGYCSIYGASYCKGDDLSHAKAVNNNMFPQSYFDGEDLAPIIREGKMAYVVAAARGRLYVCRICGISFSGKRNLTRHWKRHLGLEKANNNAFDCDEENPYMCEVCGKRFKLKRTFLRHMEKPHCDVPEKNQICVKFKKKETMCEVCGKVFHNSILLKAHLKRGHKEKETIILRTGSPVKKERSLSCDLCGRTFHMFLALRNHLERHMPPICEVCGFMCRTPALLSEHMIRHTGTRNYLCEFCGKWFFTSTDVRNHVRLVHKRNVAEKHGISPSSKARKEFDCPTCGKVFNKNFKLRNHLSVHLKTRPYSCNICGMKFRQKPHLKRHMTRHNTENRFICWVCGQGFRSDSKLKEHLLLHKDDLPTTDADIWYRQRKLSHYEMPRTDESPVECTADESSLECTVCHGKYKNRLSLSAHMAYHKTKKCRFCQEGFKHYSQLLNHMWKVHGADCFRCRECGENFSSYTGLQSHKNKVHLNRSYLCKVCGKVFLLPQLLNSHVRSHSDERPYQCRFCDKAFRQKPHKIMHERTHTGEKPYDCPTCGRSFANKYNMLAHQRIHTGEKPFLCQLCGESFAHHNAFGNHRKKHETESITVIEILQQKC